MSTIKFTVVDESALQFTAPNEEADIILKYIEKSEALSRGKTHTELLVYWGVDEVTFIAESFGYDNIPSPILKDYSWPGIFKPFDHQKTTA